MISTWLILALIFPFLLMAGYFMFVLLRPGTPEDRFFNYFYDLDEERVIQKLEFLAVNKKKDYEHAYDKLIQIKEKRYPKKLLLKAIQRAFEPFFINEYYDNYEDRWVAFKNADKGLKIILFTAPVNGILYFTLIMAMLRAGENPYTLEHIKFGLVVSLIIIIIPLIFAMFIIGFFILGISFMSVINRGNGKIIRINIALEEIIKSVKIGGREARTGIWKDRP